MCHAKFYRISTVSKIDWQVYEICYNREEGSDEIMEFLYFPEDKTEYITSFILLVIFMIGAIAAMVFFYKKSKKEEKYFNDKYMNFDMDTDDSNDIFEENESHSHSKEAKATESSSSDREHEPE